MVLMIGCGETLKNSWGNFRAYYNTYYNAKRNYNAGLKKVETQPVVLDPSQIVRTHPAPLQAGNSDFQEAIDKGAKILRKFPNSKWVDDALLLIGKSYYYQQEFYPALQKFEELRKASPSPNLDQQAIIWKGRTLLDLGSYNQGVSFLESELNNYPENWSVEHKGEIEALAGEHHAMLEHWEQSAVFLVSATADIHEHKLLGRTFFLYGQVLERLERYGEAYFSFSKVAENFPGYEYTYWAGVKQADVARKDGSLDLAISLYDKLRRDDKNFQRRDRLTYEIARTLEMKGQMAAAETSYKSLLYENEGIQSRSLKADIYYRLGKINSDFYDDYQIAAAYFDSSSSMSDVTPEAEEAADAQDLADAFTNYTRLKNSIQRADSLLWLGSLTPSQLDSVIVQIRIQKRDQLLRQRQEESNNLLANKNLELGEGEPTKSSIYGFLNYRSPELVNRARAEFRIIWGNRPLVDNWRRIEAVQQSNVSNDRSRPPDSQKLGAEEESQAILELNLDEIPRTNKEREDLRNEKAKAQYELGNLLFLNLNSPDSARYYFQRVIHSRMDHELRPRAMYSLYEVYHSANQTDSSAFWGNQIIARYPNTKYARRVQSNLQGLSASAVPQDSSQMLLERYRQIADTTEKNKAAKLRALALENRSDKLASDIYYQAIEAYIQQAKAQQKVVDSLQTEMIGFNADSLPADSGQAAPLQERTFNSIYWDSVRMALQEFDTTFTGARQSNRVAQLREMLKQSSQEVIQTCEEFEVSLRVAPSMDYFLSTVSYPEEVKNQSLSGQIIYSFVVTPDGQWQSYRLESAKTSLGIEEALEASFKKYLHFEPLNVTDPPEKLRCEIAFPVSR